MIQAFKDKFKSDKGLYEAWGNYILDSIVNDLKGVDYKISPKVRVKDIDSLVAKAFYRNKNYDDPYNDITDKVGMRLVVLLSSEIDQIDQYIKSHKEWSFSKDRDFEKEREDEPLSFDYQSMHYILTSEVDINFEGVTIPKGMKCELQVRTLLQHAYSELSHDRVYKPSFDPTAKVKRTIAKSMALLETTDEYFEEVNSQMNDIMIYTILDHLKDTFLDMINSEKATNTKANLFILEAFLEDLEKLKDELTQYICTNKLSLEQLINANLNATFLNSQPIVLFIYFMINKKKSKLLEKWPLPQNELRPFFTQLGKSTNDFS